MRIKTPNLAPVLLQLMKYSLKSRHLITLKASSAKWKITAQKKETFLLNLHNFLNVNIPVLTQSFLFVCYCLSHEIDSLISLSAEKGSSAFSNHRGKSNKLYSSRMHLQYLHTVGTAFQFHVHFMYSWYSAFPADSPNKIPSVWPSHLILKSYHLHRFCFWRGTQNVSQHHVNSPTSAGVWDTSQRVPNRILLSPTQNLLLSSQGWLPHFQEFIWNSTWTTWFSADSKTKSNFQCKTDLKILELTGKAALNIYFRSQGLK